MIYRAKITKIQSWVDENYSLNYYTRVHDKKDVYIEVGSEDEAELLEQINMATEKVLELKNKWYDQR